MYVFGGILAVAAPGFSLLLLARIVQGGLGIGLSSVVVPLYLSEIAPSSLRGRLVSLNQLMLTLPGRRARPRRHVLAENTRR